MNSSNKI